MSTKSFTHVILTRFNVRIGFATSGMGLNPEWLTHRFDLFDKFCYPSVLGQTNQNFKWLVFFDQETPDIFKQKIRDYSNWENFIPIYLDKGYTHTVIREHILSHLEEGTSHLMSTRLDNDDALSKWYVEEVQARFDHQRLNLLAFTYGYVLNDKKLYLFRYRKNPFLTLIESRGGKEKNRFRTALGLNHTNLSVFKKITRITSTPGWLQVIHDKNISNRVRGIRQPIQKLRDHFSIKLEDIPSKDVKLNLLTEFTLTLLRSPIETLAIELPQETKLFLRNLIKIPKKL